MAKTLNTIKKDFFERPNRFEPVTATYWGLSGFDDKLEIPNDTFRNQQREFYTSMLAALEPYTKKELNSEDRMDVAIMRMASLWALLTLEKKYPLSWRAAADVSELVETVYQNVSRQQGNSDEWDAILSRMRLIPSVLEQRKRNLEKGVQDKVPFYRKEVQRDGIELVAEVSAYFHKDVLVAAEKSLSDREFKIYGPELKDAADEIEEALTKYARFLTKEILPVATDDAYAIGEDEYSWQLQNLLYSSHTPASLYEYAKDQVTDTEKDMQRVADTIQMRKGEPTKPFHEVIGSLMKNAPETDKEMFQMYEDLVVRTVQFIREKKLFTLPEGYTIRLVETPAAYANVLSVAAMNPIPPFRDGIPAQFWVTPTRTEKDKDGTVKLLQENHCHSAAPNLVVHEAVPGHDLQLGESARRFIRGGRGSRSFMVRLRTPGIMYSLGVEGWAHYTEQMMAEQGFYTPEEHLFQLKDAQWRNVRIVVDVGLHTGRMTFDEAVSYFNQKTMSGQVTAEREIYRYSKWPLQAITYHLGKRDILNLREDAKEAVGEKNFDLAQFHDMLLDYDGIPVALYREVLLEKVKSTMITDLGERAHKGAR